MRASIAIGSRISVAGSQGVVTGVVDQHRLTVTLDDGDVVECQRSQVFLVDHDPDADGAHVGTEHAGREANLIAAGRACLPEVVDTLEALSGEDLVGVVMIVRLGAPVGNGRRAVVLSNMDGADTRSTIANAIAAAELAAGAGVESLPDAGPEAGPAA